MKRSLLVLLLAPLLAACLVDFPPLPEDGRASEAVDGPRSEASVDAPLADLDLGPLPDGPRPEAAPFDTKPPPDTTPMPDTTPLTCLTSWSGWSCSTNPSNCVAACGSYLLVCNTQQCTCNNGGPNKTCGSTGSTTCSACQSKLNDGCCEGL